MRDWREERALCLGSARRIVVKVGSAVLADASGLKEAAVSGLAEGLAVLRGCAPAIAASGPKRGVVLVSSGAVAAGRAALRAVGHKPAPSGSASLPERQAAAAIGQGRLMHLYDQAFARHNIITAQVLLTREDLRSRQRFLNARNTFAELLDMGALPIVNENDTVAVQELKFGDNDSLASLLLNVVEADLFINLTSAPGVFASRPEGDAKPDVLPCIEDIFSLNLAALCGAKTSVGTGGMYSKLQAAQRAAQLGVPTLIIPGNAPGALGRALAGEDLGTWVRPAAKSVSRRKFWLAYQRDPSGSVTLDDGAVAAVLEDGKSLLPGGIRGVSGNFGPGSLVRIDAADGRPLGVGISNYAATDLLRIMGKKRHEVAAVLGEAHYPEVIHRDNLLLQAVTTEE